jgi:predicted transcriptional regulator
MHSDGMTPRKLHAQSIYLEPEKADLLDELAEKSRIPKAVLLREAVDDLLVKHRKLKAPRRPS